MVIDAAARMGDYRPRMARANTSHQCSLRAMSSYTLAAVASANTVAWPLLSLFVFFGSAKAK